VEVLSSALASSSSVSASLVSASASEVCVGPDGWSDVDDRGVEGEPFVDGDSFVVSELVDADPASDDESDPPVSATAMPGLLATAAPIPRATASAPTRPINLADDDTCRRRSRVTGDGLHESSRGIDIEAHLLGRTKTRTWL
jgi:hypothetical protein